MSIDATQIVKNLTHGEKAAVLTMLDFEKSTAAGKLAVPAVTLRSLQDKALVTPIGMSVRLTTLGRSVAALI